MKICNVIITLATIISMAFGVYFFNERHDARAERLELAELRLDQKIELDFYKENRQMLRDLKKKCSQGCSSDEQKEFEELESEVDIQKDKLKELQKKNLEKGGSK